MMRVIAIYGPTGSGKTTLALQLAKEHRAPLISIDSRKVYKQLSIGTHKVPLTDYAAAHTELKLFGIDLISPSVQLNAQVYQSKVMSFLEAVSSEKTIIFFGGSGLYLDAIIFGLPCRQVKPDPALRQELETAALEFVQQKLSALNPGQYDSLSDSERNNKRRLIRKIEAVMQPQLPVTNAYSWWQPSSLELYLPQIDREKLYQSINQRVVELFAEGWLDEVRRLLLHYAPEAPGLQIMGYREITAFLKENPLALQPTPELVQEIQLRHRQYAKKQFTWATRYQKSMDQLYPDKTVSYKSIALKDYQ